MEKNRKLLRKMSRRELIEIIYALKQREEQMEKEKKELEDKLSDRHIRLERAGSIAQAALELNKIFEKAQEAADQYLESVREMQSGMESPGKEEE